MRALLLSLAAVIPMTAWAPLLPPSLDPEEFVRSVAEVNGVPVPAAFSVWHMEASLRTNPPDGIKNGKAIARGAFQMTRGAATDVQCQRFWKHMRKFTVSTSCGIKYLALKIKVCGSINNGIDAYYNGHCPRGGKTRGYGQEGARLRMKYADK